MERAVPHLPGDDLTVAKEFYVSREGGPGRQADLKVRTTSSRSSTAWIRGDGPTMATLCLRGSRFRYATDSAAGVMVFCSDPVLCAWLAWTKAAKSGCGRVGFDLNSG